MSDSIHITDITPDNVGKQCFFCVKKPKAKGFEGKRMWFERERSHGLRIKIIHLDDKQAGFIEYTPIEHAWRPVLGDDYLFIHCIYIYPNKYRSRNLAGRLLEACEKEAINKGLNGICAFSSDGPWMATKDVFLKYGFIKLATQGRFDLLVKKLKPQAPNPILQPWDERLSKYQGWHLLYSMQCPWHEKCVEVLCELALERNINLNVHEIRTSEEARDSPSGFGVFSLIRDGRLLTDHYISHTRFKNILRSELNI